MVFDRLKSMLGGRVDGPSEPLRQALLPITAVSNPLYDRAVAFVHDGSSPEVLLELDGAHQPELMTLLKYPAQLQSWSRWLPDDVKVRLREAGVSGDPNKTVPNSRSQLYRNTTLTQPQFLRFGYVLAAIGQGPNRQVPGVPKWLTALANDLCMVLDRAALPHLRWPPERFADLLSNDGMAEGDIAATVLLALSEQANIYGSSVVQPHELPGIDNYLLGFGHQIPPQAVLRLSADGRKGIAERVTANPAVGPVLAPIIAQLAIDKAKGVRAAAIAALALLPGDLQTNALRPVLLTAPAAQSAELIEYLSRTQAGGALLDEAVGNGAKLGGAVDKANARREALHASAEVQPLIVPPFVPLPDALDEALAFHQLRSYVDAALNRSQGGQFEWQKRQAQLLRQLTDGDLQQIVRAAQGGPKPKVLQHFNTVQLAQSVPAFNLVHLMRARDEPQAQLCAVAGAPPHRAAHRSSSGGRRRPAHVQYPRSVRHGAAAGPRVELGHHPRPRGDLALVRGAPGRLAGLVERRRHRRGGRAGRAGRLPHHSARGAAQCLGRGAGHLAAQPADRTGSAGPARRGPDARRPGSGRRQGRVAGGVRGLVGHDRRPGGGAGATQGLGGREA